MATPSFFISALDLDITGGIFMLVEVNMIFKGIVINLKGPICGCQEQNLIWDLGHQDDNILTHNLILRCAACDARYIVAHQSFTAVFAFDTPYPGKPEIKPEAKDEIKTEQRVCPLCSAQKSDNHVCSMCGDKGTISCIP